MCHVSTNGKEVELLEALALSDLQIAGKLGFRD